MLGSRVRAPEGAQTEFGMNSVFLLSSEISTLHLFPEGHYRAEINPMIPDVKDYEGYTYPCFRW